MVPPGSRQALTVPSDNTIGSFAESDPVRLPDLVTVFAKRADPDPSWADAVLFHEYFHGDDGTGLGASHQTGWTGLVADLTIRLSRAREQDGAG